MKCLIYLSCLRRQASSQVLTVLAWMPAFAGMTALVFAMSAFADNMPVPQSSTSQTPTNAAVSPTTSVTIGQSSQQLDQIKGFFDQSTYDDLSTLTSGLNSFDLQGNA